MYRLFNRKRCMVCVLIHLGTKGPGYGRWYLLIEDLRAFGALPFLAGEKTPALQSVLESVGQIHIGMHVEYCCV